MLPISTTTVTISRFPVDPARDSYDAPPAAVTVASGVRAHISSPSGAETQLGGSQAVTQYRLDCDPVDVTHIDRVTDDTTGITYEVLWAVSRYGLGLDHVEAALRLVEGEP
jgi:hypothetical protein